MLTKAPLETIPPAVKRGETVSKPLLYRTIDSLDLETIRVARAENVRKDLDYWHKIAQKVGRERGWQL